MRSLARSLYRGQPKPSPRFAAGLFPPETPAERAYRDAVEFRNAYEAAHRDELPITEATAILGKIRGMGRTEAQLRAEGGAL